MNWSMVGALAGIALDITLIVFTVMLFRLRIRVQRIETIHDGAFHWHPLTTPLGEDTDCECPRSRPDAVRSGGQIRTFVDPYKAGEGGGGSS